MWSNRGSVKAKAVVTKRITPLTCDGKTVHIVGIPLHWGFTGAARKGFGPNSLTPYVGDANIETPEYKAFLVEYRVDPRTGGIGRRRWHSNPNSLTRRPPISPQVFGEADLIRRSASTITPPAARHDRGGEAHRHLEVHRLQGLPGRVP